MSVCEYFQALLVKYPEMLYHHCMVGTLQGMAGFLCLYFWVAYSVVDPDPDPHGSALIMGRLDPDPGGQQ